MPMILFEEKPLSIEELKNVSKRVHQEMTANLNLWKKARSVKPSKTFRFK